MLPQFLPNTIPNWIGGAQVEAQSGEVFQKVSPHSGVQLYRVASSGISDIQRAVQIATHAQPDWAGMTPVRRGELLLNLAQVMRDYRDDIAAVVALETGMSFCAAQAETAVAIAQGEFMAGEGRRLYGRTATSATPHKYASLVRQPVGVAGLIIAANTPIANIAWKVFPALICGNAAVVKAAEDAPATAWLFGRLARQAGLAPGVLNIVQGLGEQAGAPLVAHPDVGVVSFTGSTEVGRVIATVAAQRLAKVSLELGGKNPLIVCDDADLEKAVDWSLLAAFSNAGQRCAAASRIIVFDAVYGQFRDQLVERTRKLRLGPEDGDDLGPVINERQLNHMLSAVEDARKKGAAILTGGTRLGGAAHGKGFYMAPTIIEQVAPRDAISLQELFGPITCLYRVKNFDQALCMANDSPYGLTASIHTRNIDRAMEFTRRIQAGVAVVNGGTHGSEPHMPFGGTKMSGNGTREPGREALEVYSDLKAVYINVSAEIH